METGKFPGYRAWDFLRQQNLVVVKTETLSKASLIFVSDEIRIFLLFSLGCVVSGAQCVVMSPRCGGVV